MRRIMLPQRGWPRIPCPSASSLSHPERILIVRLSHLGDVVCALGVFHALHEAFPRAEIAWAVQKEFAGLLRGLPGLDRILEFERITLASGGGRRVGLARGDWRESLGALAVNEKIPACAPDRAHVVDRTQALVRYLAPGAAFPPRSDAGLAPVELARGEALLDEHAPRLEGARRAVALHLSSVEDVRGWPLERWEELIRALRSAGHGCLVLSGPNEVREGRALAERLPDDPGIRHWIGQKDLRDLAAAFTAAAGRRWKMVTCDSGPMHLAWASGLHVVVLEGPQDGGRTGPWPARGAGPHRIVRSSEPPPCAPCHARSCTFRAGPVCMSAITAEDVLAALTPPG